MIARLVHYEKSLILILAVASRCSDIYMRRNSST